MYLHNGPADYYYQRIRDHIKIVLIGCKDSRWNQFFLDLGAPRHLVVPDQVHANKTVVKIPDNLTADVVRSTMWEQYNKRCLGCDRCNDICPEYIFSPTVSTNWKML